MAQITKDVSKAVSHTENFPPKAIRCFIGGCIMWILIVGILSLLAYGCMHSVTIFLWTLGVTIILNLTIHYWHVIVRKFENYWNHYDEDD